MFEVLSTVSRSVFGTEKECFTL